MENEMLEFKDFLAEWKGMPSLLHIDDSASVAGGFFEVSPVGILMSPTRTKAKC